MLQKQKQHVSLAKLNTKQIKATIKCLLRTDEPVHRLGIDKFKKEKENITMKKTLTTLAILGMVLLTIIFLPSCESIATAGIPTDTSANDTTATPVSPQVPVESTNNIGNSSHNTAEYVNVIFSSGGGSGYMPSILASRGIYTLPEPAYGNSGHVFDGWHNSIDGLTYVAGDTIALMNVDTVVLTALWEEPAKILTFVFGIDGTERTSISVSDPTYTLHTPIVPEGYTFKSWSTNDANHYAIGDKILVTSDMTITAVYERIVCEVKFTSTDGAVGSMESVYVNYGDTITLPESGYSKDHFTMTGWASGRYTYKPGEKITITDEATEFTTIWTPVTSFTCTINDIINNSGLYPCDVRKYVDLDYLYSKGYTKYRIVINQTIKISEGNCTPRLYIYNQYPPVLGKEGRIFDSNNYGTGEMSTGTIMTAWQSLEPLYASGGTIYYKYMAKGAYAFDILKNTYDLSATITIYFE